MKIKFAIILALLLALAGVPDAFAGGRGGGGGGGKRGGGGGGGGGQKASRPSGGGGQKASRPSGGSSSFRPSGGGGNKAKPSGGGGGARMPAKPANRPAAQPSRPSGSGGGLPSGGANKPNRPSNLPANKPGSGNKPGNVNKPGSGTKPGNLPANRPGNVPKPGRPAPPVAGNLPANKPGGDFIGMKPDKPGGANRPNVPNNRPGNLPANRPGNPPNVANRPGADGRPNYPNAGNRPGADGRPNQPNLDNRPNRPGQTQRPPRPERPDQWKNVQAKNSNEWNQWKQNNQANINNFQVNRTNEWNNINSRYNDGDWAGRYGDGDYNEWRDDVRDYRGNRAEEIWDNRQDFWNDCFDDNWWGSAAWRTRPYVAANASPWWWWKPVAWGGVGAFFGAAIASDPVDYDPGTTVVYEGDNYYVEGQPQGTATEARQEAITLATPEVAEVPVPEPAAEGQQEEWLPLGVWALTQQEQGDATMFMQLSVDRNGLVAGAYKNVMTGDEQPIIGQLDKKTQKVAWHVGEITQTVYETGLSQFDGDVASVFVHFGEAQTQTWLLVRLPSPELPPGTVKLPDVAAKK